MRRLKQKNTQNKLTGGLGTRSAHAQSERQFVPTEMRIPGVREALKRTRRRARMAARRHAATAGREPISRTISVRGGAIPCSLFPVPYPLAPGPRPFLDEYLIRLRPDRGADDGPD